MEKKREPGKCKTCEHWYNKQRLLNYDQFTGVCLNPKFNFNTTKGRLVGVVDTQNLRDQQKVTGNPAHDIETRQSLSRYLLQTEEEFGCIFHEKSTNDL